MRSLGSWGGGQKCPGVIQGLKCLRLDTQTGSTFLLLLVQHELNKCKFLPLSILKYPWLVYIMLFYVSIHFRGLDGVSAYLQLTILLKGQQYLAHPTIRQISAQNSSQIKSDTLQTVY